MELHLIFGAATDECDDILAYFQASVYGICETSYDAGKKKSNRSIFLTNKIYKRTFKIN